MLHVQEKWEINGSPSSCYVECSLYSLWYVLGYDAYLPLLVLMEG
jgi:hypothetical protein